MTAPEEVSRTVPPYRVVLVEDNPDLLEVFAIAFDLAGFRVRRAHSGREAFGQIVAECPDVVVTDLAMPDLDGFTLIRRLRKRRETRHLPVLAVTGQGYPDIAERVERSGGCGYVTKPCLPGELVRRARDLLEQCHLVRVGSGQPCARLEGRWGALRR